MCSTPATDANYSKLVGHRHSNEKPHATAHTCTSSRAPAAILTRGCPSAPGPPQASCPHHPRVQSWPGEHPACSHPVNRAPAPQHPLRLLLMPAPPCAAGHLAVPPPMGRLAVPSQVQPIGCRRRACSASRRRGGGRGTAQPRRSGCLPPRARIYPRRPVRGRCVDPRPGALDDSGARPPLHTNQPIGRLILL